MEETTGFLPQLASRNAVFFPGASVFFIHMELRREKMHAHPRSLLYTLKYLISIKTYIYVFVKHFFIIYCILILLIGHRA